jgi:hypothetical protein
MNTFIEGDYVVVPLVHPSGAYIRLDDNIKIPILARVLGSFGESISVINFFGYKYNMPHKHAEKLDQSNPDSFYVNMINRAEGIMRKLKYSILDNSEFYKTNKKVRFSYLSKLPIEFTTLNPIEVKLRSNTLSPTSPIFSFDFNPITYNPYLRHKVNGQVRLMITENTKLIHVIKKIADRIIFNEKMNTLVIKGYASFVTNDMKSYKDAFGNKFLIFKSNNNYIHVKASDVRTEIEKNDSDTDDDKYIDEGVFDIKTIERTKINSINLHPYLMIEQIIFRKFK